MLFRSNIPDSLLDVPFMQVLGKTPRWDESLDNQLELKLQSALASLNLAVENLDGEESKQAAILSARLPGDSRDTSETIQPSAPHSPRQPSE